MPTILFICTANRYRSPIAAASFKHELSLRNLGDIWNVLSAGTWTKDGLPVLPDAVTNAEKFGLDISKHRSLMITEDLVKQADLILVMEEGQKEALCSEFPSKEKIFLLTEATRGLAYDIPDPVLDSTVGDVTCEIIQLVQNCFDKIISLHSRLG